jgi:adenine-specific DNA-methyltransferase
VPELVWSGKYDESHRKVAPIRVALPFQTVETVNESAQDRQRSLDLFGGSGDKDWRNRLIWGDKKYVLGALASEIAGQVDLIYIDPPFATGQDFSLNVQVDGAEFVKEPSMIEVKAYRDTWGKGLDSYLQWFYEMATSFSELLSETGALYVHLDPGVSHFVKAVLDEVFGIDNFRNEIIWKRTHAHSGGNRFGPVHDVLLFYAKSPAHRCTPERVAYSAEYVQSKFRDADPDGRHYRSTILTGSGTRKGDSGKPWRGVDPNETGRHWAIPGYLRPMLGDPQPATVQDALDRLDDMGRILWPKKGKGGPSLKQYIDDMGGVEAQDLWEDIPPVNSQARDRVGYPTQKPVALLERILKASSAEGDLVLDCVCGSGTTAVAAETLNRRWIVADLGRFAVHTTRKRLLSVPGVQPFVVQNLGKYERQVWQVAEFGDSAAARNAAYRSFILDLYHARPINGYTWLHGLKAGRMVHIGNVDAPVTVGDIKQIAVEFRKAVGTGKDAPSSTSVDVLGWDFAFELNEVARQDAAKAGIDMRFVRIPREVLDKRAVEQGDIHFYELAALAVEVQRTNRRVTITMTNFVIPVDGVPDDIQRVISKWPQWIDYWAIDWDNHSDTFHNQWQTYRSRKDPELELSTSHEYESPGEYTVVVKVIDILGNDTTKTLSVSIPGSRPRRNGAS